LEDAQAERCVAVQARPDLIRSSSAPPRCFRGGRATSSDDKGLEGSEPEARGLEPDTR
jgi:hypothetical protein